MKFACAVEAEDDTLNTKQKVYERLLEHLEMEGYLGEEDPDFKEANINNLVLHAIGPILTDSKRKTGRNIQLMREKRIISSESMTGGYEEFVMVDLVATKKNAFVLVVEAKRSNVGSAVRQCLLALNYMRDANGGGKVFGFITTGEDWRVVVYDGNRFEMTEKFSILFDTVGKQRERWMRDYSALVDCMNVALRNGGIIEGEHLAEFFRDNLA